MNQRWNGVSFQTNPGDVCHEPCRFHVESEVFNQGMVWGRPHIHYLKIKCDSKKSDCREHMEERMNDMSHFFDCQSHFSTLFTEAFVVST